jgi:NDP-sugar pyrophosphorylase family protein
MRRDQHVRHEGQSDQPTVALLAGGVATRLGAIAKEVPKSLIEIGGRPFIEHQLLLLRSQGFRHVIICAGHLGEQIQSHLGTGERLSMDIAYSFDGDKLLGTGGALRRAGHLLGETFWVMYGDSYMDIDYRAVLQDFNARPEPAMMTVLRNNNQWDRSNVEFQDGRVLRYDKKIQAPQMQYIDYGVSLLTQPVLQRIPPDQVFDLADLYRDLAREGLLAGHEVFNRFYEIGTPASLEETRRYLASKSSSAQP